MSFRDPAIATYVQTVVVFAGVTVSALAIYFQRKSAKDLAAKASAVEFILRYEVHNRKWWKARLNGIEYLKGLSENERQRVAKAWSERKLDEKNKAGIGNVVDWLNHLEVVAVSIADGSLHEPTYSRWQGSNLRENWNLALPLVQAMRGTQRGSDDLFEAVEWLANYSGAARSD